MSPRLFLSYTLGAGVMVSVVFAGFLYQREQFSFPTNSYYASIKEVVKDTAPHTNQYLTLEQKIERLFMVGFNGTTPQDAQNLLQKHAVGGVILLEKNISNPQQLKDLTQQLQTTSIQNTGLPILTGVDQEGGVVSRISFDTYEKTPQSDITTTNQAYTIAKKRGEELHNLGINLNSSPVLDVISDKESFLSTRIFKEAEAISSLGSTMVQGYADGGIYACPKHFPGHGNALSDPHISSSIDTEDKESVWKNTQSFTEVISKNVACIMVDHTTYTSVDQNPASKSSIIMNEWLRNTLHFKGIIITDDMEMVAARLNTTNSAENKQTLGEASLAALQSGADMVLVSGYTSSEQEREEMFRYVIEQVKNGALSEKQIDEKLSRITALGI